MPAKDRSRGGELLFLLFRARFGSCLRRIFDRFGFTLVGAFVRIFRLAPGTARRRAVDIDVGLGFDVRAVDVVGGDRHAVRQQPSLLQRSHDV